MAYATVDDLIAYLGENADPPANTVQLLERASDVVDQASLYNYDSTNDEHVEATKLAACAQVQYWMETGEQVDVGGNVASYSIGNLSVSYGGRAGYADSGGKLANRAYRHLLKAGLLYRGVGTS